MHVWQIIRNYLMDSKPVVCFSTTQVYFYLFQEVVSVDKKSVVVLMNGKKILVKGTQIEVVQFTNKEFLIEGMIESVTYA